MKQQYRDDSHCFVNHSCPVRVILMQQYALLNKLLIFHGNMTGDMDIRWERQRGGGIDNNSLFALKDFVIEQFYQLRFKFSHDGNGKNTWYDYAHF